MVLVCRSQVDSRSVCWRNGCWTLWRTLHGCRLTDQQVNPPFPLCKLQNCQHLVKSGADCLVTLLSLCVHPYYFHTACLFVFLNFIDTKLLTGLVLSFSSSTLKHAVFTFVLSFLKALFLASIYSLPYSQSACCQCYLQV